MIKFTFTILLFICTNTFCTGQPHQQPYLLVLGIAQDGGYPHMGCKKACCKKAWDNPALKRSVVSLALVDPKAKKWWLFEATPDIREQLHYFQSQTAGAYNYLPDGILLTHAHIGHYTGLMELGREVINTNKVPVYALPKMIGFLETNGPWSQLVKLGNISLQPLTENNALQLSQNINVVAFTVPHRDEFSETAGYRINTTDKKYLFIPDINKWEKWDRNIINEVTASDIALLDGTFYDGGELPGRNMNEVPHPFVSETVQLLSHESKSIKEKIYFIHLNHTNPLLWEGKKELEVKKAGFELARQGQRL